MANSKNRKSKLAVRCLGGYSLLAVGVSLGGPMCSSATTPPRPSWPRQTEAIAKKCDVRSHCSGSGGRPSRRAGTFPVSFSEGWGWELNYNSCAVNCASRVSAEAFWGAFLAQNPFF